MATIYRFIVEQKTRSTGDGRRPSGGIGKGAAKKGRWVSVIGGEKGGVEHNRKMRAINPLLNRMTGGGWEKGMRLTRAGLGLVQKNTETGKFGVSGTSIAIIVAFVIQTLLRYQKSEMLKAEKANTQNYQQLENGVGAIHGQYKISTNFWTGRHTYNQNK